MSTIRIPTPLRPYTGGNKEIQVQADTVERALQQLLDQFPALKPHLLDEEGQLRSYVNVFLNDTDIRQLQGPQTPVRGEDRLMIVPSIAGGSAATDSTRPAILRHNCSPAFDVHAHTRSQQRSAR